MTKPAAFTLVLAAATLAVAPQTRSGSRVTLASPLAVALGRIDAHTHFFAEAQPVFDLLERLNVTAVNICVVDRYDKGY